MGESKLTHGWYPAGNIWLPVRCNALGQLEVDLSLVNLCDLGDVVCAALARGDILRRGAAAWNNYAIGAANQFLRSNGVDPVWDWTTFLRLNDTPAAYGANALHGLRVNAGATGVEFLDGIYESGATLPAAPVRGSRFLHTPPGRNVLMVYDGAAWWPLISFGAMTVYVDNTDGTDLPDYGFGIDGDAFKSVGYAVNAIAGRYGGDVLVNINDEAYTENITIRGKLPTGNYDITLQGTQSVSDSGTITGVTLVGGRVTAITDAAKAWGVDVHKGQIVQITSGAASGQQAMVLSNNATTLTVVYYFGVNPGVGDTFDILNRDTVINGYVAARGGQKNVYLNDIRINNTGSGGARDFSWMRYNRCRIDVSASYISTMNFSTQYFWDTYVRRTVAVGQFYVVSNCGTSGIYRSIFDGCNVVTQQNITVRRNSHLDFYYGSVSERTNNATGIWATAGGSVEFYSPTVDCRIRTHNVGLQASSSGSALYRHYITYTACTTNELPEACDEEFQPVTVATDMTVYGYYPGGRIDSATDYAYISWRVPDDFLAPYEVELCWIAITGVANFNIVIDTQAAAHDEPFNTHVDTVGVLLNTTAGDYYEHDIVDAFTNIAPGDGVGIRVRCPDGLIEQAHIIGVRFKYTKWPWNGV